MNTGVFLGSFYKTADAGWYKQRLSGLMYFLFLSFTILMIRLFYLQIIEGEEYRRLSENNCIRLQSIDAPRGLIFDRNRNLLVDNSPSFDLSIIVRDAKPLKDTIERLAQYINTPKEELMNIINSKKGLASYKPVLLKSNMGWELLAAIEVHLFDLPGVIVEIKPRRYYIRNKIASHLLGYLGQISPDELKSGKYLSARQGDFIGKFGIEKSFQNYLSGNRGGRQVEVNAVGQVVRVLETVNAVPGHNIYLTIDYALQEKAESLLQGVAGAAVAMDPSTGQILAMVSSPSFDQNSFVTGISHENWNSLIKNPMRPMENKAIQGEYPPASTYKIVTAIAGLEEGVVDQNTTFFCPGYHQFGNRVFRCWKKGGHGNVDIIKALAQSCDVYFYQVGERLGVDRLAWYAKACGLGVPTGIDLDHEGAGLVPSSLWKKEKIGVAWQKGETLSIAIGQGYNLATPLQMLSLTAAVANGGKLLRPVVLHSIETVEGDIIKIPQQEQIGVIPVRKQTLEIVKRGLWEVVNTRGGTAWIAHVDGLNIAGKTGTAQVVGRKKGDPENREKQEDFIKPHAWFVSYAPADDPKIAVAVLVEHGEHGSSAAGPVAREMIKTYFGETETEKSNQVAVQLTQ
ncbi:MAG: penicillin-binding protein 2 [Desulfobacterium sp.]|nr:penicillin-binding protein 2 [Desulfobacterium sp.]